MAALRRYGAMGRGEVVVYLRRERVMGWPWPRSWIVAAYDVPPDVGQPGLRPILVSPEPPAVEIRPRAVWHEHDPAKPRKGQRIVTLDQFRWRAVWLADLKGWSS